jgi:hypothetical protein
MNAPGDLMAVVRLADETRWYCGRTGCAEQGADVVLGARRGQAELAQMDGRDDGFGLGHGPLVDLAWVCDLCHELTLPGKHDK